MNNINGKVTVLSTVQAAGADVVSSGGVLRVTGADPILISNIQGGQYAASTVGVPEQYTITVASAVAANTTYTLGIQQFDSNGEVYNFPVVYVTPASAPSDTVFYAAVAAQIQVGITGGQILGTVSSSISGVVFKGSADAPVAQITGSQFSVAKAISVAALTAAGSSCTDAAPRVLTAGANHNLTLGKIYKFTFSGVTGTGAADLNRTLFGIPLAATTITLLGTSATGAVTTTSATLTVDLSGDENFFNEGTGITGFNVSNSYVAVEIEALSTNPVVAGNVIPQVILADATANSTANINAFINALRTALASTPAAIG
jgi:hypothetical protein